MVHFVVTVTCHSEFDVCYVSVCLCFGARLPAFSSISRQKHTALTDMRESKRKAWIGRVKKLTTMVIEAKK